MNKDRQITPNKFLDKSNSLDDHKDGIICKGCLFLYESIHNLLLKKYGWRAMFELTSLLCAIGLDYRICRKYIIFYGENVLESLIDHYINGEYICTFTHICKNTHFVTLQADDYAKDLLKDKPTNNSPTIDPLAKTWKVLHVTDIHVDLNYKVGSRGLCPTNLCCRDEKLSSIRNLTTEEKAGKWGYPGRCDIPLSTLRNFVEVLKNDIKPDFIIWTGDNPAHDAYDMSAWEVAKLFSEMLKNSFGLDLPVYPSLGNHEKFPADQFNPYDQSKEKEFLGNFANIFSHWLNEDSIKTFKNFGGYSQKHPNSNLRIISTNCMLCDVLNFQLIKDPTDPGSEVAWLEKVLRQAERDGEVVYLIGHIPIGDSAFLSECAKRFKALVDRFSHIIRGQFYGHTHYDEIKIMHEYFDSTKISGVMYIAPSLTT